jgi:hypothetical protein
VLCLDRIRRRQRGLRLYGDGRLHGGEGGEAGHLLADAAGTAQRHGGVRPHVQRQVGVGGRGQHDDLGGTGEAELLGLLAQAFGGDGRVVAEAGVVGQDPVGGVEQPVPGAEDHHPAGGAGERVGGPPRGPVVGADVQVAGRGLEHRRLAGAAGGSAWVRRFLRGLEREPALA